MIGTSGKGLPFGRQFLASSAKAGAMSSKKQQRKRPSSSEQWSVAKAHFGSSHFGSRAAQKSRLFSVLLISCKTDFGMVQSEVPDGWLQVIRGPKPPSVRWPSKKPTEQPSRGRGRVSVEIRCSPRRSHRGGAPQKCAPMASSKVARIQAAIANLAVDDIEEKASLEAALVRATRHLSLQSTSPLQIRWHSSKARKSEWPQSLPKFSKPRR